MNYREEQTAPGSMGPLIRKKRKQIGMSMRELARRSGLTPSFLSQVETGRSKLSLSSLEKISRGLKLPLADLLTAREPASPRPAQEQELFLVRRGLGPKIVLPDRKITSEFLTPNLGSGLEVIASEGLRSSGNTAKQLNIEKKEVIYVLEGSVQITIEQTSVELHAGDSIYYAGSELREFSCITEKARWLSIIAYGE